MTAMELVSDRASKAPIDAKTAAVIQEATYNAGAMIRVSGPNIILSPPLVLSEADADTILSALDSGLEAGTKHHSA